MKTLHMRIEDCVECPLLKFCPSEKFFYCGSPHAGKHLIEKTDDISQLKGVIPGCCPLPEEH